MPRKIGINEVRSIIKDVLVEYTIGDPGTERRDDDTHEKSYDSSKKPSWPDLNPKKGLKSGKIDDRRPIKQQSPDAQKFDDAADEIAKAIQKFGGSVIKGDQCSHTYEFLSVYDMEDREVCPECGMITYAVPGGEYCGHCMRMFLEDPIGTPERIVRWIKKNIPDAKHFGFRVEENTITFMIC